jgi:feruloyl esterase
MIARKHRLTTFALLFGFILLSAGTAFSADVNEGDCLALKGYVEALTDEAFGEPITDVAATWYPADGSMPEYCEVTGRIFPETDFAVRLPTDWNERFIQFGGGGWCGSVRPADRASLNLGYAGSISNGGHDGTQYPEMAAFGLKEPYFSEFYPDWERPDGLEGNPYACQMIVDFAIRAHQETPLLAKKIISHYYGSNPIYSYFSGCSRGGMEGLMNAQKSYDIFDGLYIGAAPVGMVTAMHRGIWNVVRGVVLKDVFTEDKKIALYDAVYGKCDGVDGLVDGLIDDPLKCNFDPLTDLPACPNDINAEGCFTLEQRQALKEIYDGPHDSNGQALNVGTPLGSEYILKRADGSISSGLEMTLGDFIAPEMFQFIIFDPPPGSDYDLTSFDWDEDTYEIQQTTCTQCFDGGCDTYNIFEVMDAGTLSPHPVPKSGGFEPLKANGGKIIQYHGWGDSLASCLWAPRFYEQVMNLMGTAETKSFYKLYVVPGMGHCGGGIGCNQTWNDGFGALVNWVENGTEPEALLGTRGADTDPYWPEARTRPLCPYPEVARWNGSGSIEDAENFMCVPPIEVRIKPEALNLKRRGKFTAFITVPHDYRMRDWNLQDITCEGAPAIFGRARKNVYIAKFCTQDMQDVTPGKSVTLTVKGEFYNDGVPALVQASDTVRVIGHKK